MMALMARARALCARRLNRARPPAISVAEFRRRVMRDRVIDGVLWSLIVVAALAMVATVAWFSI